MKYNIHRVYEAVGDPRCDVKTALRELIELGEPDYVSGEKSVILRMAQSHDRNMAALLDKGISDPKNQSQATLNQLMEIYREKAEQLEREKLKRNHG